MDELLSEKGVTVRPDGGRIWRLKDGEVQVGELREGGQVVATELRVPLSERAELMREVVLEGAELARLAQVRLVDPQLGRALGPQDGEVVAEQYLRTARYAGEMMGLTEAVAASFPVPDTEGFRPTTKVVLGIIAFFVLLYFLSESLVGQLGGE